MAPSTLDDLKKKEAAGLNDPGPHFERLTSLVAKLQVIHKEANDNEGWTIISQSNFLALCYALDARAKYFGERGVAPRDFSIVWKNRPRLREAIGQLEKFVGPGISYDRFVTDHEIRKEVIWLMTGALSVLENNGRFSGELSTLGDRPEIQIAHENEELKNEHNKQMQLRQMLREGHQGRIEREELKKMGHRIGEGSSVDPVRHSTNNAETTAEKAERQHFKEHSKVGGTAEERRKFPIRHNEQRADAESSVGH